MYARGGGTGGKGGRQQNRARRAVDGLGRELRDVDAAVDGDTVLMTSVRNVVGL